MSAPRPIQSGRALRGTVRVPGSKSITQRYMNLALIAGRPDGGDWTLNGPLRSDDTRHFASGLEAAGIAVEWSDGSGAERLVVSPGGGQESRPGGEIFCGHGGTMMRFLVAAMTTRSGTWVIDGSPRLRERPLGPLLETLRALGAEIECLDREGYPPVRIEGGTLRGGRAPLDASESSQYLSAVLMAALAAETPVELVVDDLVSAPYVDLTVDAIARFGGRVERDGSVWSVRPERLHAGAVEVEGDWSSASYWLVAAPLTGGEIRLEGLSSASRQGDRDFIDVTRRLGGVVEWDGDVLVASGGGALRGVEVDLSKMPDLVPTLAAVAPFAAGITRINNVAHLRIKESDRLAAMSSELERSGATVVERSDGLDIDGVWSGARPGETPVTIQTYDDHRIAMSLAVHGLRRPGLSIADPAVVEKSYPAFWRHLDSLSG